MATETEIRERLERRRRDLEQVRAAAERRSSDENGQLPDELSSEDQHPGDLATDLFERTRNYSVAEMAEGALEEIELAFKNLEAGKYGVCEVCGQPIDEERLEARPEARFCVEHSPRSET